MAVTIENIRVICTAPEGINLLAVRVDTNVPGLYAAGDCTGGLLQISTAVGEGAKAAMSMIKFVRQQKKE